MPRWFQVHIIRRIETIRRSKWARPAATLLALLLVTPMAAMAQVHYTGSNMMRPDNYREWVWLSSGFGMKSLALLTTGATDSQRFVQASIR